MPHPDYEAEARELCRIRGIDPDARVAHGADPDPDSMYVPYVMLYSPAWARIARECAQFDQLRQAFANVERSNATP